MWGLLAAVGSVGLLVRIALTEKSDEPVLRPALQRRRRARILATSGRRPLTRSEAEDGLVLARRLGRSELARTFEMVVREKRRTGDGAMSPGRGLDGRKKS